MGNKNSDSNKDSPLSAFQSEKAAALNEELSEKPPFTEEQLEFLKANFSKLDLKEVSVVDPLILRQVTFLRRHPLFERILAHIIEDLQKINKKKLGFDMFVETLSVFHITTDLEEKFKYLFKLLDEDRDFKIGLKDLSSFLDLMHNDPTKLTKQYTSDDIINMAERFIKQHGSGGVVKYESFRQALNEDEVLFFMTLRFK